MSENLINNRYTDLAACLDLEGSPGPFILQDVVVPVVLICEAHEFDTTFLELNAGAASDEALTPSLRSGIYLVTFTASIGMVLAASDQVNIHLRDASGAVDRCRLMQIIGLTPGNVSVSGTAKVKVREGERFHVDVIATGAGNAASVTLVAQLL